MAEKTTLATSGEDMDVILSYVDGYRSVLVLSAACEMELFDKVNQSPEGVTAAKLAEDNEWDEDATHRLLNGCVALKTLLKSTGQDGKEIYKLAGPGRYLQKHSDPTVWEMTTSWAKRMFGMITKLPEEVRTAKNKDMAFPRHVTVHKSDEGNHGDEEQGHGHHSHGHGHGHGHSHGHGHGHGHGHSHGHDHGERDPQELLIRYRSMGGCIEPYLNDLLKAFDLSKFTTAVDLGGDFFETDLPVADLYVLGRIVHDWKSDQVATLLKRVFNATNSGGAIVLLEKNMNDTKDGPISAHVWDLMVMSHCGGKLRSAAEYTTLLQAAGYKDVKIAVTSDPCPLDVIMATKP